MVQTLDLLISIKRQNVCVKEAEREHSAQNALRRGCPTYRNTSVIKSGFSHAHEQGQPTEIMHPFESSCCTEGDLF